MVLLVWKFIAKIFLIEEDLEVEIFEVSNTWQVELLQTNGIIVLSKPRFVVHLWRAGQIKEWHNFYQK